MSVFNHGFLNYILTLPFWILLSIGAILLIVFLIVLINILEGDIKITGYDDDYDNKHEYKLVGTTDPVSMIIGCPISMNHDNND